MNDNRLAGIWGLVAEQSAGRGGRVAAGDVCAAAVAAVEVTGAWLSASGAQAGHLMQVTDLVSEQLAELQLTLGEGPAVDVAAFGGPALASDLAERESGRRWPAFAPPPARRARRRCSRSRWRSGRSRRGCSACTGTSPAG